MEKAVAKVHMKMSISGAEDRSNTLLLDYKRALESAGYGKFPLECPKLAIRHIHERLKPPILKEMVEDEFEKQETKGLRKKDFYYFISEVVRLPETVEKTHIRRKPYRPERKEYPKEEPSTAPF